jgi:Tfp pilus assembly protein PilO
MKEVPLTVERVSPKTQMQERVGGFLLARRNKMFGPAEFAALAGSCLILLLVVLSYFYFMLPARSRLSTAEADRTQLQSNLKKSQSIVSRGRDTEQTVEQIAASLERFEQTGLVNQDLGRMDLYDQLNQLIVKNGLRNTSGPTYTTLETIGSKAVPGKSMNTKWQSAYPGIAVAVTVEGQYQSVRHFIRDIENSKQFIIINQVELQRATENNSAPVANGESSSGSRASLVSLQLNMATYFQRTTPETSGTN